MSSRFGTKLRYLRRRQGLTQADLAEQLALARQGHVSNLEMGRREPSVDLVLHIAQLFAVSADYLLRDEVPVEAVTHVSDQPSSPSQGRCFGTKVHSLRHQSGLTQAALAQHLGLTTHVHVSTIERGRKDASLDLIRKIADFFEVTIDYLLRDDIAVEDKRMYGAS
ncbi:MAG: helix-turn-helix transcriptional regulator [Chloroflexota bacterium]